MLKIEEIFQVISINVKRWEHSLMTWKPQGFETVTLRLEDFMAKFITMKYFLLAWNRWNSKPYSDMTGCTSAKQIENYISFQFFASIKVKHSDRSSNEECLYCLTDQTETVYSTSRSQRTRIPYNFVLGTKWTVFSETKTNKVTNYYKEQENNIPSPTV